jgi:hypothetical protein
MHYTTIDPRKVRLEPKTIVGLPVTSSAGHRIKRHGIVKIIAWHVTEWRAVIGSQSHTI